MENNFEIITNEDSVVGIIFNSDRTMILGMTEAFSEAGCRTQLYNLNKKLTK